MTCGRFSLTATKPSASQRENLLRGVVTCHAHMRRRRRRHPRRRTVHGRRGFRDHPCTSAAVLHPGHRLGASVCEYPGCGHTTSELDRAFGIQPGEKSSDAHDAGAELGLICTPCQRAQTTARGRKYRRIATGTGRGIGEWFCHRRAVGLHTEKDCAHYIGEEHVGPAGIAVSVGSLHCGKPEWR